MRFPRSPRIIILMIVIVAILAGVSVVFVQQRKNDDGLSTARIDVSAKKLPRPTTRFTLGGDEITAVNDESTATKTVGTAGLLTAEDDQGRVQGLAVAVSLKGMKKTTVEVDFRSTAFSLLLTNSSVLTADPVEIALLRYAAEQSDYLDQLEAELGAHGAADPDYLSNSTEQEAELIDKLAQDVDLRLRSLVQDVLTQDKQGSKAQALSVNSFTDRIQLVATTTKTDDCKTYQQKKESDGFGAQGDVLLKMEDAGWGGVCLGHRANDDEGQYALVNHSYSWGVLFSDATPGLPIAVVQPRAHSLPALEDLGQAALKTVTNALSVAICSAIPQLGSACPSSKESVLDALIEPTKNLWTKAKGINGGSLVFLSDEQLASSLTVFTLAAQGLDAPPAGMTDAKQGVGVSLLGFLNITSHFGYPIVQLVLDKKFTVRKNDMKKEWAAAASAREELKTSRNQLAIARQTAERTLEEHKKAKSEMRRLFGKKDAESLRLYEREKQRVGDLERQVADLNTTIERSYSSWTSQHQRLIQGLPLGAAWSGASTINMNGEWVSVTNQLRSGDVSGFFKSLGTLGFKLLLTPEMLKEMVFALGYFFNFDAEEWIKEGVKKLVAHILLKLPKVLLKLAPVVGWLGTGIDVVSKASPLLFNTTQFGQTAKTYSAYQNYAAIKEGPRIEDYLMDLQLAKVSLPGPESEIDILKATDWNTQEMVNLGFQEDKATFGTIDTWQKNGSNPVLIGVDYTSWTDASGAQQAQALVLYTDDILKGNDGPSAVGMQLFDVEDEMVQQVGTGLITDLEGRSSAESFYIYRSAFSLTKDGIFFYANQTKQGYQTRYYKWRIEGDIAETIGSGFSDSIAWMYLAQPEDNTDGGLMGPTELPPSQAIPYSGYSTNVREKLPPVEQTVTWEDLGIQ